MKGKKERLLPGENRWPRGCYSSSEDEVRHMGQLKKK